ncbi:MAG: P1 family peptidase [Planctomycetota bacterium]
MTGATVILPVMLAMLLALVLGLSSHALPEAQEASPRSRARDLGIEVGFLKTGALNAITDVPGVLVGHTTRIEGEGIRTGVTAILPHAGNLYQEKVPAAIRVFNGYGKLAGLSQVDELGTIETPIILTNTLSVGTAMTAVVQHTLRQKGNESVRSVNAVVGETNDGFLNDIRGLHVTEEDVIAAIESASPGPVAEGSIGAGTGTVAFGWKGGIGTSSRVTPGIDGIHYTAGVLVQSNFGRELVISGIPFSREMEQARRSHQKESGGGSCMIVIATDAPLSERNLRRLALRAFTGMGRTTMATSNGSGDYTIAFSTAYRIPERSKSQTVTIPPLVDNATMSLLFRAVEEAVEEAILNSLFMATTVRGYQGHTAEAIPLGEILRLAQEYKMRAIGKRLDWSPYEND